MKSRGIYVWIVSVALAFIVLLFVSIGISYSSAEIAGDNPYVVESSSAEDEMTKVGVVGWGIIGVGVIGVGTTILFGKKSYTRNSRRRRNRRITARGGASISSRSRVVYPNYYHERAVERRM